MKGKSREKRKVKKQELESALIKKALGYDCTETVEEYAGDDNGEIRLLKKKITVKSVPPDMTALKILLDENQKNVSDMTDEQLELEKGRLLKLLQPLVKKEEKIDENKH